jgi:hypothetical protein
MTLTIELTPEQESRLAAVARSRGLELAQLAQRLVTEHLPENRPDPSDRAGLSPPERVRALVAEWQAQDNTPTLPPVATKEGETPTEALFRQWEEEDAAMTEEEREAEDRLWQDIEKGLAENRGLRLRRPGL